MFVLILESNADLAGLWKRHLERNGARVHLAESETEAFAFLEENQVDVIVLDLSPMARAAIAIADLARFRWPDAKIVFVTKDSFFSDGSIFNHVPNAAAMVVSHAPPDDIAAIVEHHGQPNQH